MQALLARQLVITHLRSKDKPRVSTESLTPGGLLSTRWLVAAPVIIAILSLGTSIFQSWNYGSNIAIAQRNMRQAESLRTCRDLIDAFFAFRLTLEDANHMKACMSGMAGPTIALYAATIAYAHAMRLTL